MALNRTEALATAIAGAVAILTPAWLLTPAAVEVAEPSAGSIVLPNLVPPAAIYRRDMFSGTAAEVEVPVDAPELAGIAGRIGRDAVALVRTGDGRTRTVTIGDSVDGWTLKALSPDAASFARGGRDVRVPLPTG